MSANTLFLRIEGPLQAWGDQQSKFVIRHTTEAPTKSGVIGMLCAALGVDRRTAGKGLVGELVSLRMGVRVDRPGVRWWDYQTVGAGLPKLTAEGSSKEEAVLTRREYLCDASFLVVLQGQPALVGRLEAAVRDPRWSPYLGRKCCPPSRPLLEGPPGEHPDILSALTIVPWRRRLETDEDPPKTLDCLIDWWPVPDQPKAPPETQVWYDVPESFEPPAHRPRLVIRQRLQVGPGGKVSLAPKAAQRSTPPPARPRADYTNSEYRKRRQERLKEDLGLCVFCKSPATTVQHVTYRRAPGGETLDDLRSLCRLCHDAVTMIEYGEGMGLDRINPEDARWRDQIVQKRDEIIRFRSLEARRRRFSSAEVE